MRHIKDRLSDYHDFMKKLVDDHQMVLASDILKMIEQLQDDLEEDEKENGWIPCSERLPKESDYYMACVYDSEANNFDFRKTWFAHKDDYYIDESEWRELYQSEKVTAWRPLPEPYKED